MNTFVALICHRYSEIMRDLLISPLIKCLMQQLQVLQVFLKYLIDMEEMVLHPLGGGEPDYLT